MNEFIDYVVHYNRLDSLSSVLVAEINENIRKKEGQINSLTAAKAVSDEEYRLVKKGIGLNIQECDEILKAMRSDLEEYQNSEHSDLRAVRDSDAALQGTFGRHLKVLDIMVYFGEGERHKWGMGDCKFEIKFQDIDDPQLFGDSRRFANEVAAKFDAVQGKLKGANEQYFDKRVVVVTSSAREPSIWQLQKRIRENESEKTNLSCYKIVSLREVEAFFENLPKSLNHNPKSPPPRLI